MKRIDLDELSRNTGREGKLAFVAVDGKVYDVTASKMWKNGRHVNAHQAGQELSDALQAAPHGREVFERVEMAGELAGEPRREIKGGFPQPPPLVKLILSHHPHPPSVHFPIALTLAAAAFLILSLILDIAGLADAAFYNLIFATLAVPFSMGTGLLSWHYNYGGRWTAIFRAKFVLSIILLIVLVCAIVVRLAFPVSNGALSVSSFIYFGLILLAAPIVATIGWLGGKITFPS